jgi:uncharacterized membrane protein
MAFWVLTGLIVGAILGGIGGGLIAAVVGGALGAGLGALIGRASARSPSSSTAVPPAPSYGVPAQASTPTPVMRPVASASPDAMALVLSQLESIDARLAQIEARIGLGAPARSDVTETSSPLPPDSAAIPTKPSEDAAVAPARAALEPTPVTQTHVVPPRMARAADGTLEIPSSDAASPLPDLDLDAAADEVRSAGPSSAPQPASATNVPPPRPAYQVDASASPGEPPREASAVWRWITGGNALTRVGIVILFFGVAFLLRYFAEIVTVPIEIKLAGAGTGGLLLAGIGFVLARRRPAYGLSLQGAGMGIVYLTVFAAFRLYEVVGPPPAIALLVVVAAATIALALRHDSQPLAALALAGGFLAPVLIRTDAGNAALLFGYFAVLNAVIFALAWKRAWRPLNVLGFVFTFVLGALWGNRFYTPSHYPIVQPYLILFFAFYVGIAILYARRSPLNAKAPVDGVLVFGVPIVGFAFQMAIVRSHRYGVAWSAATLAAIYGVLWFLLRTRTSEGLALLAKAFAALAVIFATLAIPFAVDPRATSAWWALEAAAVYWLGTVQRQPLARGFALLLQFGAALAFLWNLHPVEGRLLLNANFLGMVLIGVAAFASVWSADRYPEGIGSRERVILPLLFVWGIGWWILGGVDELRRQIDPPARIDAALAWVVASSALALMLERVLRWPRIAWLTVTLLPAMALAGAEDLRATHTTLTHFGWLVWPLAWIVLWATLRVADRLRVGASANQQVHDDMLRLAHTVCAIALVAWASWELSEWAGRRTAEGTVWIACGAAIPAILYLLATVKWRDAERWPFDVHGAAYGASAGTTIAALLFVWFAIVNLTSPGNPAPLPYLPLLNPLDLTLIAALGALAAWDREWGRHTDRTRYGWLGALAFVALNGVVVRTAHHWGDVPWRFESLIAYKPAQAALTLTWTVTALALMLWATRRGVRTLWMVGAALLAIVVVKLFAIDLAALSGLTRVIAFMGVGLLLLVIGYVAPLPPAVLARPEAEATER